MNEKIGKVKDCWTIMAMRVNQIGLDTRMMVAVKLVESSLAASAPSVHSSKMCTMRDVAAKGGDVMCSRWYERRFQRSAQAG